MVDFKKIPILVFLALLAAPAVARATGMRHDTLKKFVSLIDVVASKQDYFIGKAVSSFDYDFKKDTFWVGGKNGTGIFHNESRSALKRDTAASKYTAVAHADEDGWSLGTRFGDYKKHAIRFGRLHRDIYLDPYIKTINQGACAPCNLQVSQADVSADTHFFTYTRDISRAWALDAGYLRQKASLQTGMGQDLTTTVLTAKLRRETRKGSFETLLARYKRSRLSGNNHIRLSYTRKVWKQVSLFAETGLFTDGLPTADGAFSDLGDRFVFNYLSGENKDFNPLYSDKFGYYSIGIKASFKFN